MEMKEIKINIPEGYEIDKENSTFECIKFKSKEDISNLTYKNVCISLFPNDEGYYTNTDGDIVKNYIGGVLEEPNNAPNRKQLERLLALNQLLNIAEYCNKLHTTGSNTYTITYSKVDKMYYTSTSSTTHLCGIKAIFNRKADAQAVINNSNFRTILDTIYK